MPEGEISFFVPRTMLGGAPKRQRGSQGPQSMVISNYFLVTPSIYHTLKFQSNRTLLLVVA